MQVNDILPVGLIIVTVAIAMGIGAAVLASVDSAQTTGSVAKNITGTGLTSMKTLMYWLPTIALVIAAAIIIGLIVNAFRTN